LQKQCVVNLCKNYKLRPDLQTKSQKKVIKLIKLNLYYLVLKNYEINVYTCISKKKMANTFEGFSEWVKWQIFRPQFVNVLLLKHLILVLTLCGS